MSSRDDGAVLIWVALMMTVLLGVGALAVDLGYGYAVSRELSVTADGAALAGAQEAGLKYELAGGCGSTLTGLAKAASQSNYAAHVPQGAAATLDSDAVDVQCTAESVTVTVALESTLDTSLAGVFGISTMNPRASAGAEVYGAQQLGGLRPFTVCFQDALAIVADETHQSVYAQAAASPGAPAAPCTSLSTTGAPGNWGYAAFDVGGSQSVLKCLIMNGYGPDCGGSATGTEIGYSSSPPSLTSPGNTGNSIHSSTEEALDSIVGQTILLPVGDLWDGNGSPASYNAKGGIAVRFCGWVIPKNNGDPQSSNTGGGCWDPAQYEVARLKMTLHPSDPNKLANVGVVIQWVYEDEWVTSYIGQDVGDSCPLGDVTCIPALRLVA